MSIYEIPITTAAGETTTLKPYRGQVLLIVNTASKCGFTPQYEGLEQLYQELKSRGLVVLGFPCNQFANQEPGDMQEIQRFCSLNYGVTFPIFEKVNVRGGDAHPLFTHLTQAAPGLLGIKTIKWNFTKFVVDRDGQVVRRFAPKDKPEKLRPLIESLL